MSEKSKNPYLNFVDGEDEKTSKPVVAKKVEEPIEAEEKKPTDEISKPNPYLQIVDAPDNEKSAFDGEALKAAGTGAAVGALARYKGAELSGNALRPGKSVFAPSEKQIETINAKLRALTNDPKIDVRGMTQEQVNRLLSGGEGSTLGTTGRQRTETFNLETQRRAEHQKSIENMVKKLYPNVQSPLAAINEPMVQLDNSLVVPASTATQVEGQKTAQDTKALTKAQSDASKAGRMSGMAKVGQGSVGGALTAAQAYNMMKQTQPIDWTQYLSLLGGMGTTFGGQRLGTLGGLAQIPYAIKHREEIARGMGLGEINPTAFGGAPEALETPIDSAMGRR